MKQRTALLGLCAMLIAGVTFALNGMAPPWTSAHAQTGDTAEEQGREAVLSTASTFTLSRICGDQASEAADFCAGYVMATFDQLSIDGDICPTRTADTAVVVAVGRTTLVQDPHSPKHPGVMLREALKRGYPCQ